jgi:hypothetical protein
VKFDFPPVIATVITAFGLALQSNSLVIEARAVNCGKTVVGAEAVAVQPFLSLTVTVYVPAATVKIPLDWKDVPLILYDNGANPVPVAVRVKPVAEPAH